MGLATVNHKRVYRIMRHHGLLWAKHTVQRPKRPHEGTVITLRRNLRWSSDGFKAACRNGATVRVAFALDCCDLEIVDFVASTGGISGAMVRDFMAECVIMRFGASRTP